MYVIVSPAYGRDYNQPGNASKDWFDGKDFILQYCGLVHPNLHPLQTFHSFNGKYCSTRDFEPDDQIEIRFNKLQNLIIVTNGRTCDV